MSARVRIADLVSSAAELGQKTNSYVLSSRQVLTNFCKQLTGAVGLRHVVVASRLTGDIIRSPRRRC